MVRRASFVAAFLICVLLPAEGAPPPVLRYPFWACSDGKGTISLFWLPVGGDWPAGGYRLERVSRGKATVLGGPFRPGQDAKTMMELDPGEADAVRMLADKVERGTLTDDEKSWSISVLGRAAAADIRLGRALGVRYTDVPRVRGKLAYRLTALGADGGAGSTMESAEIDPGKPTAAPGKPGKLRAEERGDGVALFWTDPPAGPVAPVVGYRLDRRDGGKKAAALTLKPLLLDRHLRRGEPEFLDGAAPAKKLTYQVRSVDVFGRQSAPSRTAITVKHAARTGGPPGAAAAVSRVALVSAAPASSLRIAAASADPAPARAARGETGGSSAEHAPDSAPRAVPGRETAPGPLASAARGKAAADDTGSVPSSRGRMPSTAVNSGGKERNDERSPEPAPTASIAPTPPVVPEPPQAAPPPPEPTATASVAPTPPVVPEPPQAAPRVPEASESDAGSAAADPEATARQAGLPPSPVIVAIAGLGDRVLVRFRPGEPNGLTRTFLVVRSESPTGAGVTVGRPVPGDAREWEDTSVSAGQFFWYRLVAVDGAGNRSEPSKPKWVSTGSR